MTTYSNPRNLRRFLHEEHLARRRRKLAAALPPAIPALPPPPPTPSFMEVARLLDVAIRKWKQEHKVKTKREPSVHIGDMQKIVAASFKISRTDILSHQRFDRFVKPRQIAMYLAAKMTPQSLPEIGKSFGFDHTTVLHAIRKVRVLLGEEPGGKPDRELIAKMPQIIADIEAAKR